MQEHEVINAVVASRVKTQAFADIPEEDSITHDAVNHPSHYTSHPSGIEAIQITGKLPFALGNAVKYLMRSRYKKNRIEDLKKAKWYLEYQAKNWAKVFETYELHLILKQFQRTVMAKSYKECEEDRILVRLFNIWTHDRLADVNPASELQACIGAITQLVAHLESK